MRVCTQCGFTYAEFQTRGLLGCPECYACFGDALWADLLQIHPELHRQPPFSLPPETPMEAEDSARAGGRRELARLKEMLAEAVRGERYEEAAGLRLRIREREENRGAG